MLFKKNLAKFMVYKHNCNLY